MDIVEKLRERSRVERIYGQSGMYAEKPEETLEWEAAAEIERLRAALKQIEIALARDDNVPGAMRIILALEQKGSE